MAAGDDGFMSYESPITITEFPMNFVDKIAGDIEGQKTEYVMQCIGKFGVNVDVEELKKALAYDRDSYHKGLQEGIKAGKKDALYLPLLELNLSTDCEHCPRYRKHHHEDGFYKSTERCKGHLSWLCRKIREAMDDE